MEHFEHKVRRIGIREKGGAALITAVAFVFFLTLFGLAFYRLGETDIDLFGRDQNQSKALYAAEAGIDKVRWMLKESQQISWVNPFSTNYDPPAEASALAIANPTAGDFFPGVVGDPYFKVSEIQPEILPTGQPGSRVKVQAFGSVDMDADGVGGLTPIGGGKYDPDPDDVNRRFEAYIGLPGTLGERFGVKGISAAAGAFYVGVVPVSLSQEPRPFRTLDGDYVKDRNGNDRFLYFSKGTYGGILNRWGFIFSDPAPTISSGEIDEVELPPWIFDADGNYIDDDGNDIPDYFQDLDLRVYEEADITFDSDPVNDPTAGADGKAIIYVKGNITIDSVDFGYLNDDGEPKGFDWEGYPSGEFDLTFIANGDITVNRVDCGNVGRLVLVAKNIILEGDYNTKVNGIAIAYNDITLDGSGCVYGSYSGILTHQTDFSRPVKYTAYFLGSMVAGNHIVLLNDGWTVIYDENVINGNMYSTTLAKPTLTYERVEAEDFNTTNNWDREGLELKYRQEDYIQEDIDNFQADYLDKGIDETPDLMKMYQDPIWRHSDPDPAQRNNHDFAISDGVYCDFTDAGNAFEDSDISIGLQNWDNYTTIHFWMALDNWKKVFGSKTTLRKSSFDLWLYDTNGNELHVPLSYPSNDWVADPGKVGWKLVRITPQLIDPLSDFDMRSVRRLEFYYDDIVVSWYINDIDSERIQYNKNNKTTGYGDDGYYYYMKWNGTGYDTYPVQFEEDLVNNRYRLYYEDPPGNIIYIQWNWDPSISALEDMYFEDTLDPLKSALNSVLKVDRIELPGKPATNDSCEYGLPHCLRLEINNWKEL